MLTPASDSAPAANPPAPSEPPPEPPRETPALAAPPESSSQIAPPEPAPVVAPPEPAARPAPTSRAERITSLDVVRGFALLGILLMNIVGFGLYIRAYDNPTAAGGETGANLWTWIILHVVAEGKMRCLFSLVFGASVVLLTSRLEGRPDAADIYYRRTLWLLLFGIVHAYLLWQGDILYPYALCGLTLYPFRNLRPRTLLIIGAVLLVLLSAFTLTRGYLRWSDEREAQSAVARSRNGRTLTDADFQAKESWRRFQQRRNPSDDMLRRDAAQWQGDFLSVVKARGRLVLEFHSMPYYHPGNFDIWGMMFLGMGLFKLGVLSAKKSLRFYTSLMCIGYAVGGAINSYTAWLLVQSHFDPVVHLFSLSVNDVGRFSVALGHMSLLLILCRQGWLEWLISRLGAVGQMAFSNYILTSVLCALIFTGYGLKLYGELERYQLYYIVAGISLLQLGVSPIWLRYYRFGPLEWCWRALTYWHRPPMRIVAKEAPAIPPLAEPPPPASNEPTPPSP